MFKWLKDKLSVKQQSDAQVRQILVDGRASWTNRNYFALAQEGYCKNVIAYSCINRIASSVADIPLVIKVDGNEVEIGVPNRGNPIADFIARPNPKQSYKPFMFEAVAHRLIGGNTYIHLVKGDITDAPYEMTLFRPDRVSIETRGDIPYRFVYVFNGREYYYYIDQDTNLSEVLQIKTFNPVDDLYGLSPISAAAMSIDQHNEASEWNKALLENSSKPAGILTMKDRGDNAPVLTPEQQQSISHQINAKMSGPKNAGKILTMNYDMQWQAMSFSPTDMDWLSGKQSTARDICLAFGFPAILLGDPQGSTFNNVAEAKLALYEDTVIPLANTMLEELSHWLSESTNQRIELIPDLDKVSSLMPRREIARTNARLDLAAGIITTNEARAEIGYEEVDGGDEILVPAGKLPLDFDMTGFSETQTTDAQKMTDKEFYKYLLEDGFDSKGALRMTALTSTDVAPKETSTDANTDKA